MFGVNVPGSMVLPWFLSAARARGRVVSRTRGSLAQPSCNPDVGSTRVGVQTSSSLRRAERRIRGSVNGVSRLVKSSFQGYGLYVFESLFNLLLCHPMVHDLLYTR